MANFDAFGKLQFDENDLLRKATDTGVKSDEEIQALRDLVDKASQITPKKTKPAEYDSLDTLQDIGYEEPTQEQLNAPGRQAAAKYIGVKTMGTDDPTKMAKNMVGTGPAAAMGAYDRMPASEEELSLEESLTPEQLASAEKPNAKTDVRSLLDRYNELTQQRNTKNMVLDLGDAGSLIADTFTKNGGGKALSPQVMAMNKGLRDRNEQPMQDLLAQSKAADTQTELEMADANSDISKFARERAIANAAKMGLKDEDLKRLENMSAKQLEKAGLFKADASEKNRFVSMQGILSKTGLPLVRNEGNGKIFIAGTDKEYDIEKQGVSGQFKKQVKDAFQREWTLDPISQALVPTFEYDQDAPPAFVPSTTNGNQVEALPQEAKKKTGSIQKTEEEDDSAYLNKAFTIKPSLQDDIKNIQNKISSDKQITDLNEAVSNIDTSKALVKANLPGSAPMLARALLSIYESGGRFTDADVDQMKGPTEVNAKLKRFLVSNFDSEQAVSDLDQSSQMALLELLETKKTEQLSSKYGPYVNQLNKMGVDKDVAARYVTGDRVRGFSDLGKAKSLKLEGSKKDPKIEDYAKQHKLDYEKAKSILTTRGYKPNE